MSSAMDNLIIRSSLFGDTPPPITSTRSQLSDLLGVSTTSRVATTNNDPQIGGGGAGDEPQIGGGGAGDPSGSSGGLISLATGGIGIGGNAYGGQGGHGGDAAVKVELILPDGSTMPYFGGFSYGQTPSGGTTGNTMVLIVGVIMGLLAIFLLVKR